MKLSNANLDKLPDGKDLPGETTDLTIKFTVERAATADNSSKPDPIEALRADIEERIAAYGDPREYFIKRVVEGISSIAAALSRASPAASSRVVPSSR